MYSFDEIKNTDPQIAEAIEAEIERQNSHIELIASDNWVSKAVMAAIKRCENCSRNVHGKISTLGLTVLISVL